MADTSKHRILVVDDEPSIRECMAMLLSTAGYEVTTAEDGSDALLQLRSVTPAVIISDLNMPQMSGFELLSILRRRFPQIAVIAISGAYGYSDHVPDGAIADAFWAKGAHPEELLRIVSELIHPSVAQTRNRQRQIVSRPDNAEGEGCQESAFRSADQLSTSDERGMFGEHEAVSR